MKFLFLVIFLISCSQIEYKNYRTGSQPKVDKYKPLGKVIINAKVDSGYNAVNSSSSSNITYTVAQAQDFTIDTGSLSPIESGEDLLDLGSLSISILKVNKLDQCGIGNDEKCTSAIIRIYTTDVTGHGGISGFVNKDDDYGVDIIAGEGTANLTVGLTPVNAAIVDSYTIPAGDKKLTSSDFSGVIYEVEVDFSNAGAGDYEMNLVIELAVAL